METGIASCPRTASTLRSSTSMRRSVMPSVVRRTHGLEIGPTPLASLVPWTGWSERCRSSTGSRPPRQPTASTGWRRRQRRESPTSAYCGGSIMAIELPGDFDEFLRSLNDHRADYLLIGGIAVALHGYPRATQHLDVWIDRRRANAERVVAALRAFGFDVPELTAELFLDPDRIVRMGVSPLRIFLTRQPSSPPPLQVSPMIRDINCHPCPAIRPVRYPPCQVTLQCDPQTARPTRSPTTRGGSNDPQRDRRRTTRRLRPRRRRPRPAPSARRCARRGPRRAGGSSVTRSRRTAAGSRPAGGGR